MNYLDILWVFLLILSGFILSALFYYLIHNNWNGYANKYKLIVALCILTTLSILFVFVPEFSTELKTVTGLDLNFETSKVGYITLGFGLSKLLESFHKKNKNEKDKKTK